MTSHSRRAESQPSTPEALIAASAAILFSLSVTMSSGAQEPTQSHAPSPLGGEHAELFEPAGKYALDIDGEAIPNARTHLSLNAGSALLLTAPELPSPLLVRPRKQRLDLIDTADLRPHAGGAISIAAKADLQPAGTFTVDGTSLLLSVGEQRMRLMERPLLGLHDATAVAAWDPIYARRARRYSPPRDVLERLHHPRIAARVRVYFGSWCPRCRHAVPRLMRLAAELEGSGLEFEFFGLPRLETDAPESFWHEAQTAGIFDDDVELVPLAVIYRGDRRIGRITDGWGNPERELEKILISIRD